MTACGGDRVAVGFTAASGTTACTGDGAISVAAASEMIARDRNNGIDGDDGDDGEGAAVSIAAASNRAISGVDGLLTFEWGGANEGSSVEESESQQGSRQRSQH